MKVACTQLWIEMHDFDPDELLSTSNRLFQNLNIVHFDLCILFSPKFDPDFQFF